MNKEEYWRKQLIYVTFTPVIAIHFENRKISL